MARKYKVSVKLRDLIPIYGIAKDFYDNRDTYFKPIDKLPDDFVADLSLKISLLYAYNFGVIECLRRFLMD